MHLITILNSYIFTQKLHYKVYSFWNHFKQLWAYNLLIIILFIFFIQYLTNIFYQNFIISCFQLFQIFLDEKYIKIHHRFYNYFLFQIIYQYNLEFSVVMHIACLAFEAKNDH